MTRFPQHPSPTFQGTVTKDTDLPPPQKIAIFHLLSRWNLKPPGRNIVCHCPTIFMFFTFSTSDLQTLKTHIEQIITPINLNRERKLN